MAMLSGNFAKAIVDDDNDVQQLPQRAYGNDDDAHRLTNES